ncbi:type VI secretion protein IcmF/TssM N-terminal domain-containing protein [Pollutimonas harenae]|uniref:SPOR domain-containing protein n=1 Tax=Pollutimonas harenae TaxID=657015 RepID=A0A853GZF1_9BURK|nr:type VI secretion protein IcmF/TssM N-terminal domain-containing protein [Pollutimonas harenae]NYT85140.1 SPOR domain-containing protein [Pollutimonas harenae]TEA72478.1 hypothetical protein ERD84_00775 [Pollutimonas harenae]
MAKKLLSVLAGFIVLLILALACWLVGVILGWQLWQSLALFLGCVIAVLVLGWLRRRWHAWRLRRRLARPALSTSESTAQLDADWSAGLKALRQSRLSRFGSPLYVLPWFLTLGPEDQARSSMLHRAAGRDAVTASGDENPALQWWLLPSMVMLDPAPVQQALAPSASGWQRMLHWMMHTRRREPLNGLVLCFSSEWLGESSDAQLSDTGYMLRQRLDELVRIYNARVPVYIVLTHCESVDGFSAWARSLADDASKQAMGYVNKGKLASIGEFIGDAFGHIVARMSDLRVLQGRHEHPTPEAFGLPERMLALSGRLDKVLRPAFQVTPYAETPLLRGLFLTAGRTGNDSHQADWFSAGLFDDVLPGQRHAWQALERMRHWRRLLRHAAVAGWLFACVAVGVMLVYSAQTAREQMRLAGKGAGTAGADFSGDLASDLRALHSIRRAVHTLDDRQGWQKDWMPFQRDVNKAQSQLADAYADAFYREVIAKNLNPLLATVLNGAQSGVPDQAAIALAQNLVRRINLLQARLAGQNLSKLPLPGTEVQAIAAAIQKGSLSPIDGLLLGDMYRDYLSWQKNKAILTDEQHALQKALSNLGLSARPIQWIYTWTALQPDLQPMRMSDFWTIGKVEGLPEVPSAMTLSGKKAVTAFMKELARATGNDKAWQERQSQYQKLFLEEGLEHWYTFSDAFVHAPDLIGDASSRRTVLASLMTTTGPYNKYMGKLAKLGQSLPAQSRPEWLQQAMRLEKLSGLVQLPKPDGKEAPAAGGSSLTTLQNLKVVQDFGGDLLKALPEGNAIRQGVSSLSSDQQALSLLQNHWVGVRTTIHSLQQGEGTAMDTAKQIWSYGHDPKVKSVALVDAHKAMEQLRRSYGTPTDPRTAVVWQLESGAMDFTLDYAARSAACSLQRNWDVNVLGTVKGLTDKQLANTLLFGPQGQVNVFLDGDASYFVSRDGTRYMAREALGDVVPLNGQFYAFAGLAQKRTANQAGQQLEDQRNKDANAALKEQAQQLDQKISKLEAVKGNVTLSTEPSQTNASAQLRPESISLSLQCASGPVTLQNLNFANSQVFSWSMSSCANTMLSIKYPGFELQKQWSGAGGFIQFLNEYASGVRRYTPADFPEQADMLKQAGIEWLDVSYRQQGQESVLKAFAEADKLHAQAQEIQARLDAMQQDAAQAPEAQSTSGLPALPEQIIMACMGTADSLSPVLTASIETHAPENSAEPAVKPEPEEAPPNQGHDTKTQGMYAVQVGVFAHPEKVSDALEKAQYTLQDEPITLHGKDYRNIRVTGYKTRQAADDAAKKIGRLLGLKPVVVGG